MIDPFGIIKAMCAAGLAFFVARFLGLCVVYLIDGFSNVP